MTTESIQTDSQNNHSDQSIAETKKTRNKILSALKSFALLVMVPIVVAVLTARLTVQYEIEGRVMPGKLMFDDVGYRYFHALDAMLVPGPQKNGMRTKTWDASGPRNKTYKKVLRDILTDIRWLRTNPYFERGKLSENIAILQNVLIYEIESDQKGIHKPALEVMCALYSNPGNWGVQDSNGVSDKGVAIREYANALCSHNT